jgi:L-methionine (R)-S-oxide reductase
MQGYKKCTFALLFKTMAENIHIPTAVTDKAARYESLIPQISALVQGESDFIANVANIMAALKDSMGFFWVGIYLVKNDELVLGPFQGPVACTRIALGKGVCGTAWNEKKVIVVEDVNDFPGHIACSSFSKSEIVIPAFKNGEVFMVFDVDSDQLSYFDHVDEKYLGEIVKIMEVL